MTGFWTSVMSAVFPLITEPTETDLRPLHIKRRCSDTDNDPDRCSVAVWSLESCHTDRSPATNDAGNQGKHRRPESRAVTSPLCFPADRRSQPEQEECRAQRWRTDSVSAHEGYVHDVVLRGCEDLISYTCMTMFPQGAFGVLTQETHFENLQHLGSSYLAASYVKTLESAGARVIPIRINLAEEEYVKIFTAINGVLLPGGGVDLKDSGYARAAKIFYDLALAANDKGDYFPIWGTCLGFEQLTVLTSGELLLTLTQTEDISLPLNFTETSSLAISSSVTGSSDQAPAVLSLGRGIKSRTSLVTRVNIGAVLCTPPALAVSVGQPESRAVTSPLCFPAARCSQPDQRSRAPRTDSDVLSSKLFRNIPRTLYKALSTMFITANFHSWSLSIQSVRGKKLPYFRVLIRYSDHTIQVSESVETIGLHLDDCSPMSENFTANEKLHKFYNILSTNSDGVLEFISTFEAYHYPIYGVQWHPEKNPFEWKKTSDISHVAEAVHVAFYMADFFVNEGKNVIEKWGPQDPTASMGTTRKSQHQFSEDAEAQFPLIYNYCPKYTGNISVVFEQMYFF
ncbi:unnamed protein product [Ranitomeya imitator]|uniref:folate gamma-glutamyl hydrolase n=1 Tax=Ranitomeya imitator TaxID=111125 RepID=A0ABN9MNP5_9NEOB|nr:unnamed protein product [Ranitomeya imitator]